MLWVLYVCMERGQIPEFQVAIDHDRPSHTPTTKSPLEISSKLMSTQKMYTQGRDLCAANSQESERVNLRPPTVKSVNPGQKPGSLPSRHLSVYPQVG